MSVIQNKLQTKQDIEDYKKWLSSKPRHYLKCLLNIFKRDSLKEVPKYYNLQLRVELVNKEIEIRNQS
ncbi:hypothetical protein KTC96_24900 (plasmid) [Clostridium estertheticum]|uniref:hypothetical protein n=1 Tax=Clostridium estertheticum TaxID=238834 RepID=UPI001C7CD168|nr:hypothetical protein [Clostridium estertheticum]MBX4259768.1 hypothetical protein [Clostridium estertheticum]WLC73262.1 hypothetical protein KTC96_24900 [Clostridium estertheticum]